LAEQEFIFKLLKIHRIDENSSHKFSS